MTPRPGGSALRTVLSLTSASAVAAAVALIGNILAARLLGPELRGHVAFVLQSAYFLAPFIAWGADRSLLASGRHYVPGRRVTVGLALAVGIVLLVASHSPYALAAAVGWVTAWYALRRSAAVASGRLRDFAPSFLAYQAVILLGQVGLALASVTWWPAWVLVYAAPAIVLVAFAPAPARHEVSWRSNTAFVTASLARLWWLRGQRLLVPVFTAPSQLGLFAVVATATEPLYWAAQALADHHAAAARGGTSADPLALGRIARLLAVFVPMSALTGLALWWLLVPVFGDAFAPAEVLIVPLCLAAVALALHRQVEAALLAGPSPHAVARLETTTALLALLAYPPAAWLAGGLGAAWASCGVYAAGAVVGMIIHRTLPTSVPEPTSVHQSATESP